MILFFKTPKETVIATEMDHQPTASSSDHAAK